MKNMFLQGNIFFVGVCLLLFILFGAFSVSAFYFGDTGLFDIPTAYIMSNGNFNFGADIAIQNEKRKSLVIGADFGLLNFAEISFKGIKKDNNDYLMSDIKIILSREEGILPAFAIGVDNIGEGRGIPDYELSYFAIISKRLNLPFIHILNTHIGFGNRRYMSDESVGKYLHGIFFGLGKDIDLNYGDLHLQLIGEFKGNDLNFGTKCMMKTGLMLNFALEGINHGFNKTYYHIAIGFTNTELMKEIVQSIELAKQAVRIANETQSEKNTSNKKE
ncbi:MAG: hypothetical protein ACPL7B_03070 [Candidatus Poribacteria bacterium]